MGDSETLDGDAWPSLGGLSSVNQTNQSCGISTLTSLLDEIQALSYNNSGKTWATKTHQLIVEKLSKVKSHFLGFLPIVDKISNKINSPFDVSFAEKLSAVHKNITQAANSVIKSSHASRINPHQEKQNDDDKEKTIVITKITDKSLVKDSASILSNFNKITDFKEIPVRVARRSVKGNLVLIFNTVEDADKVKTKWKSTYFGNGTEVAKPYQGNIGFVKNVLKEVTDEILNKDIKQQFPTAECVRLSKDGNLLKTVKITFKTKEDLNNAHENGRIRIGHVLHNLELPENNLREPTRCWNCNKFHKCPAKFCENEKTCNYCASSGHNFKECTKVNDPEAAKCINCSGNHKSSSKNCKIYMQLKDKINGVISLIDHNE